uniref:Uncharacterized protein n=1 Tax=Rheinheimera sp. BAL341 TaxID=1708203 RepID=A0A486XKW7_9GAMM
MVKLNQCLLVLCQGTTSAVLSDLLFNNLDCSIFMNDL